MKGEKFEQTQDQRNSGILDAWFPYWVTNTFLNYPKVLDDFQVKDVSLLTLKKENRGPAVIVGSGPSLDKSAPLLEKWEGAVFCCGSNANIARRWHAGPDYVCVFDAGPTVVQQLQDLHWDDTMLITHPSVHPSVLDFWKWERRYYIMRHFGHNWFEAATPIAFGDHPYFRTMGLKPPAIGTAILNAGCTVNNAVQVANFIGYNPLFLIGVDCGYPEGVHRCTMWKKNAKKEWIAVPPTPLPEARTKHLSDNGVITTEEQIEYKLALMAIWRLDRPRIWDCSEGIITEIPRPPGKDARERFGYAVERQGKLEYPYDDAGIILTSDNYLHKHKEHMDGNKPEIIITEGENGGKPDVAIVEDAKEMA